MPEVFPELGDAFALGAKVIHIDLNVYEIAKNHPVELGVVADPKLKLALLADVLEAVLTPAQRQAATARAAALTDAKRMKQQAEFAKDGKYVKPPRSKMSRSWKSSTNNFPPTPLSSTRG